MNWRLTVVLACMALALVGSVIWVPVQPSGQRPWPLPAEEAARRRASLEHAFTTAPEHERDALRELIEYQSRWDAGYRVPLTHARVRWTWCWRRAPVSRVPDTPPGREMLAGEFIRWTHVAAEQIGVLALGGGLLAWVVRRERRRRAALG